MSAVYDQSRGSGRWPLPLRGLARVIGGINVGWQDCLESFEDWQRSISGPPCRTLQQSNLFFTLLGQPLSGANEFPAPWDEYLEHLEDMAILKELGVL